MHDRNLVRTQPDTIRKGLARKGMSGPVDQLLRLDEERRELLADLQAKQAEQNQVSKTIGQLMQLKPTITKILVEIGGEKSRVVYKVEPPAEK